MNAIARSHWAPRSWSEVGWVSGGLLLAAIVGAIAARGTYGYAFCAGVLLILIGAQKPVAPFVVVVVFFAAVSAVDGENPFLPALASGYREFAAGLAPSDVPLVLAGVGAFVAFATIPFQQRRQCWTSLSAPVLALGAIGLISSLVIHREGSAGLAALMPTIRFVSVFFIASVLFARGFLSRTLVLRLSIVVAQFVGMVGIYNATVGNTGVAAFRPEAGVEAQAAFYDSASAFVLVTALTVASVRVLWSNAGRLLYLLTMPVPLAALLLSGRRAMYIAFLLALLVVFAASIRARPSLAIPSLGVAAALVVGLLLFAQSSPVYQQRLVDLGQITSASGRDVAISDRKTETRIVLENIGRHPVLGIGVHAPYALSVQFRSQSPFYVHNSLLAIWLKTGLAGLAALIWLVIRIARLTRPSTRDLVPSTGLTEGQASLAALGVILGFLSSLLTASFLTASERFPVFAGLLMALLATGVGVNRVNAARSGPPDTADGSKPDPSA